MLLYKYLKYERKDILKMGLIRFTQPKYFNDPFEALPNVENIFSPEFVSDIIQVLSDKNQLDTFTKKLNNQDIKKIFQELNLTFHKGNSKEKELIINRLLGNTEDDLSKSMQSFWDDQIGILSFSEENDNLTMWSHYANEHTGFVIGFNPTKNITDIKTQFIRLKKIHYSCIRPSLSLFELEQSKDERIKQWLNAFLLTKSKGWSYENEWRQINYLKYATKTIENSEHPIKLFKYNIDSIESIYLGCRMSPENKKEIVDLVKNLNIKIYEMKIDKKNYYLNKYELNNASL